MTVTHRFRRVVAYGRSGAVPHWYELDLQTVRSEGLGISKDRLAMTKALFSSWADTFDISVEETVSGRAAGGQRHCLAKTIFDTDDEAEVAKPTAVMDLCCDASGAFDAG